MNAVAQSDEQRWQAVRQRDRRADGTFFYGVRTTGVYCRPSCPARLPRRENVSFHPNTTAAEAAGYRACKRCRPTQASQRERDAAMIAEACRTLQTAATSVPLQKLADAAGMSPFHFHRVFKQVTGVTPRGYAAAHREGQVRDRLQGSRRVTDVIFDAGYGSTSRFYERAARLLGMNAGEYRDGGRNARIRFAVGETSLGAILVAATERGVCVIEFGADPETLVRSLQDRFPNAELHGGDAAFEQLVARVVAQVERPQADFALPLDVRGTAFQQRVWQALMTIPAGKTATYGEIAAAIGHPRAIRAVASACAANQTALAIPCHRVIRTDASLSGYRWGIERKQALLDRERKGNLNHKEHKDHKKESIE
jgi:AraC family transcriptional regulator, regulatory protein of adaptative response / methylated-DNA-[protein]-cysteine methyltransferase